MKKVTFQAPNQSEFYPTLKRRVEEYFAQTQQSSHGNTFMWFKLVFFIGGLLAAYTAVLSFGAWWAWGSLGFFAAMIGLNICHDAIHGSLSANATFNKVFSWLFDVLGASHYIWRISHNQAHHTYTNIHEHDDDISTGAPLLRLTPHQKKETWHQYQHIYAFFLYPLASLLWVTTKDFRKYFAPNIGSIVANHPPSALIFMTLFKILYMSLFLVTPLVVLLGKGLPLYQILLSFVFMHLIEGFTLAIIFKLAHEVALTAFPLPNEKNKIEDVWAVHQLKTTANFACENPVLSFFCGGLNFQVEHHLFPLISHVHYPALSPIVRQTAEEYGLPYHAHKTFLGAVHNHYVFLKTLAEGEVEVAA
ncbi:MAG: fatty acid desaturase family protein [Bacteroidales bacterium]